MKYPISPVKPNVVLDKETDDGIADNILLYSLVYDDLSFNNFT